MALQVDRRNVGNWHWRYDDKYIGFVLDDGNGYVLAWVSQRTHYCDRGHYFAMIEVPCELDAQDMFPRYYMRFETAKDEIQTFLLWRLFRERAESMSVFRNAARESRLDQIKAAHK